MKILRGRVLTFLEEPQGREDHASYRYIEDGAVVIQDGRIVMVGDWNERAASHHDAAEIVDHRPHLIMAGFIDTHIHFPQMQVIGAYAGALLEWLNTYTFAEEQRFADEAHATRIASRFSGATYELAASCSWASVVRTVVDSVSEPMLRSTRST